MSDITPNEPVQPAGEGMSIPPTPEAPDVLADVTRPVGSSYDPMPLQSTATDNNWMGIVALITGIIGLSLVAIIFGILGLGAAKKGKATNRGMSITGIVLGVVWMVLGVLAIVAFVLLAANVSTNDNAEVGDCYVSTIVATDTLEDFTPIYVECDSTTNAEVYYVGTYAGSGSPTDARFTDELLTFCTSDEALAQVDRDIATDYFVEYYLPNSALWAIADHTVVCSVATDGGPVDPDAINE